MLVRTGGTESKPVGLVYVGLADPNHQVTSFEYRFGTIRGRSLVRYISANAALDNLRRRLMH